jgi:pyocin large subunit-like protein
MVDEPHDVVKLLLARMESHPEEFRVGRKPFNDRWMEHISDIEAFGNAVDTAALAEKIRDFRLGEIHERVMDELCNGPERRRFEEVEANYERKIMSGVKK